MLVLRMQKCNADVTLQLHLALQRCEDLRGHGFGLGKTWSDLPPFPKVLDVSSLTLDVEEELQQKKRITAFKKDTE